MAELPENWLTQGWVDFEYKKYLLLAYLQEAGTTFHQKKLYPKLSELVDHYRHLNLFKAKKLSLEKGFPKEISKLDFEQFKVEYRQLFEDDELLKEIDQIVEFALPEFEKHLGWGKELYEEVEEQLEVFPVGIIPLRKEEGYLFLTDFPRRLVNVYYYSLSIFENVQEKFRGIHTKQLFNYTNSITENYEQVKYRLITENPELPAPAAYAIEFKQSYPLSETMLPVAKRSLIRFLSL